MPTSCICYKGQVKIASLCPASACESFAYISDIGFGHHLIFFPLGNGFSLLRSKIFSFVTSKLKKKNKTLYICVWKRQKLFCCPHFSLGYGNSQSTSLLLLRGYLELVLSHQRHKEACCFAPGSFFKAPRECCGRLLGTNLECSSQIPLGAFFLWLL